VIAAINGVAATAAYATSINNTFLLIKNKINNGGNTPNDLITKAAYAVRYFTGATGTFTFDTNVVAGAAAVVVGTGSTSIAFTTIDSASASDDNTNALLCTAAIDADATVGPQVICTVSGGVLTLTGRGANRATLTVASATIGVPFGATIAGVPVQVACGTVTVSGSADGTDGTITIDGQPLPSEGKELARLRADVGIVFQSFNLLRSQDDPGERDAGAHQGTEGGGGRGEPEGSRSCWIEWA